jgi:hypothetical protein
VRLREAATLTIDPFLRQTWVNHHPVEYKASGLESQAKYLVTPHGGGPGAEKPGKKVQRKVKEGDSS